MTDNIKFPPMPLAACSYGMSGEYTQSQMRAYAREAVRLNAQADTALAGSGGWEAHAKELEAELERIKANPVHQFRKAHCADWFDGRPDHTDGGGPYETRTLYALGSKTT